MPRWRNPRPPSFSNQAVFSARYSQQPPQRDFPPRPPNAWRKKYSLVNVPPRPTLRPGDDASASGSRVVPSQGKSEGAGLQPPALSGRRVGVARDGSIIVGVPMSSAVRNAAASASQGGPSKASPSRGCETSALTPSVPSEESKPKPLSAVPPSLHHRIVARSRDDSLSVCVSVPSRTVQGASKLAPDSCRTISEQAITLKTGPQQPPTLPGRESRCLSARKSSAPRVPALQRASATGDQSNAARTTQAPGSLASLAGQTPLCVGTSPSKHPALALQTAPTSPAPSKSPKFRKTKYTWVANPGKCSRASKRWPASRASENSQKFAPGAERTSKSVPKGDLGAKQKKSGLHPKAGVSSSKYKWKASSLRLSPSVSTSAFTWQREERGGPGAAHFSGGSSSLPAASRMSLGHGDPKPTLGNTSSLHYKLKSRTKIIKRKGSASSPAEKRSPAFSTLLLKSRYCLRKRNSPWGKSPSPTARKSGAKGLVQIGKHRLRRLPASRFHAAAKEGKCRTGNV
ncbi:UNVERIFIED_CONTAM: hypothetical protein K2H54_004695 [Gekko kuhli]